MNKRWRSLCNTLALALLVAMAAVVTSFSSHAPVARADTWVINITIDNTGGTYSGFSPCSGCSSWPGMTLSNYSLDQYGEWSACCASPTIGDYVPFDPNENPNYNNGNGPGSSYTANAPYTGHGTSGWFEYRFDQPVVNISTGAEAAYFYVNWDVAYPLGSLSESCQYKDADYNTISTDCYAGDDQANGGCNVPDGADYCFEFDTSCTPVLFNCADGPSPSATSALGGATPTPAPGPTEAPTATVGAQVNGMVVTGRALDEPTIVEGTPLDSMTMATFTDAGAAPANGAGGYTATVDWGDGTSSAGTVSGSGGGYSVAGTHTYTEEGKFATKVTVTRTDVAGETGSSVGSVTVNDADKLTGRAVAPLSATVGTALSDVTMATFTDTYGGHTDTDDFAATINWGDNSSSEGAIIGGGGSFSVVGSHTYVTEGTYTVTVVMSDR